ncbi:hypothetical protein H5410_015231 [Solanum commersonii]|uniref:Uncharacterized protein n=1 Tax=Solanum commersonii TaxID=4109 RepID=A0A9J5ZTU9_SOLCO|nr:hypothetical protein H5410_015231 [Solanum commersonii]
MQLGPSEELLEYGTLSGRNVRKSSQDGSANILIRRNSLWQGKKEKKVYHLVKWQEVILSKAQGGLLWRYSQDPQSLWSMVIKAIYEIEDNWITKPINSTYGVSLWMSKGIMAWSKKPSLYQSAKW